jgi:hypothetical protein
MINVYKTSTEDVKKYRDTEAISQSYLKELDTHLDNYLNKEPKKETVSMMKGSMVDCILTNKEEDFERLYYISDKEFELSEVEKEIIDLTFSLIINSGKEYALEFLSLNTFKEELVTAILEKNWFNGKPGDKRIETLIEKSQDYFDELSKASNKIIIKKSLYDNQIIPVVNSLKTHPNTAQFFAPVDSEDYIMDFYYQLPIYFEFEGTKCKALLDLLVVIKDLEDNVIKVTVVDLKTTDMYTLDFVTSVQNFRYDIQCAFYLHAVKYFIENTYENIKKIDFIKITNFEYDFIFVVESFKKQNPIVFNTDTLFITTGMYGHQTPYKKIRGFVELLNLHKYYVETEWKQDKLLLENNGVLTLTFDNGFKINEN